MNADLDLVTDELGELIAETADRLKASYPDGIGQLRLAVGSLVYSTEALHHELGSCLLWCMPNGDYVPAYEAPRHVLVEIAIAIPALAMRLRQQRDANVLRDTVDATDRLRDWLVGHPKSILDRRYP